MPFQDKFLCMHKGRRGDKERLACRVRDIANLFETQILGTVRGSTRRG